MSTVLLSLLTLAQVPVPQSDPAPTPSPLPARLPVFGVNLGTYTPVNATTRSRFGGSWVSFSPGLGPVLPLPYPALLPDFSLSTQQKRFGVFTNRAFLAMVGAQYQWPLFKLKVPSEKDEKPAKLPLFLPYTGVSLGGVYANLRSQVDEVNSSGIAPAGSLYVGTSVGFNGFLEARWRAIRPIRGFELSGLDLSLGLRF